MSPLIPLRRKDGSVVAHAIVDEADFAWLTQWLWCVGNKGYVVRSERGDDGRSHQYRIHRQILGLQPGDGLFGDHKNGNPLDNRRANLRILTREQSAQNRGPRKVSTSGIRGVSRVKKTGRWHAAVGLNGRLHSLGSYTTKEEAGRVAAAFRAKHMPYSVEEEAA